MGVSNQFVSEFGATDSNITIEVENLVDRFEVEFEVYAGLQTV